MQALPTLLTNAQLDGLLSTFEKLPGAGVTRTARYAVVTAVKKATRETVEVFRASKVDKDSWSAEAVQGLIVVK